MNAQRAVKISKFLSLVLRHKPDEIGITLDDAGWIDVTTLLAAMARHGTAVTREELDEVVATSDKKRFAFSDDGVRIRASQGHSVEVDLDLDPMQPPEILFHGTATRFLPAIRRQGLQKMQRQHVHLCADKQTAASVGQRHGKLAMLEIRAGDMQRAGLKFFRSANGVWLTDAVPPEYLAGFDQPESQALPQTWCAIKRGVRLPNGGKVGVGSGVISEIMGKVANFACARSRGLAMLAVLVAPTRFL